MLAVAVTLGLAICAHAAPAEPQTASSAPRNAAAQDLPQEVKPSGVIRGRITSLDTGKPLRRAQVSISAEGIALPPPPRTASTSNDGRYEFRDIPPGRYTLRVQRRYTNPLPGVATSPVTSSGAVVSAPPLSIEITGPYTADIARLPA